MLRAVYYARVSTEDEMQLSALKNQIEALEEYIRNQKDWILISGYVDEGKSATQVKGRNEYSQLVNDMYKNLFDIVVIVRIDRGWRNDRDWAKFETDLTMSRVRLYTISNHSFYNFRDTGDWLQAGIEAKVAEMFSRQQSVKMLNAFQQGKKKGHVYGNVKMWGYDYINGEFIINEKEKQMVQYVFNRYIEGVGFRTIAKELYELGFHSRHTGDKIFPLTTLKRIVRNMRYTGTVVTNKTYFDFFEKKQYLLPKEDWLYFENQMPAIIDMDTYNKANEILNGKRKKLDIDTKSKIYGYFQGSYALSGKVKCAKCGHKFYYGKHSKPGIKPVWHCSSYKNWGTNVEKGGCDNIKIPAVELDKIVRQIIYSLWEDQDNSMARIMTALEKAFDTRDDMSQEKNLSKQLECVKEQKKEMRQKLYKGLITDDEFQDDTREIDNEIDRLKMLIAEITANQGRIQEKTARLQQLEQVLKMILADKVCIGDDAIKSIIKEIVVDDYNLEIVINGDLSYNVDYIPPKNRSSQDIDEKYPCVSTPRPNGHTS